MPDIDALIARLPDMNSGEMGDVASAEDSVLRGAVEALQELRGRHTPKG